MDNPGEDDLPEAEEAIVDPAADPSASTSNEEPVTGPSKPPEDDKLVVSWDSDSAQFNSEDNLRWGWFCWAKYLYDASYRLRTQAQVRGR